MDVFGHTHIHHVMKQSNGGGSSAERTSLERALLDEWTEHYNVKDKRIINVGAPTEGRDAATKQYTDHAVDGVKRRVNSLIDVSLLMDRTGEPPSARSYNANKRRIINVAAPVMGSDTATKDYSDALHAKLAKTQSEAMETLRKGILEECMLKCKSQLDSTLAAHALQHESIVKSVTLNTYFKSLQYFVFHHTIHSVLIQPTTNAKWWTIAPHGRDAYDIPYTGVIKVLNYGPRGQVEFEYPAKSASRELAAGATIEVRKDERMKFYLTSVKRTVQNMRLFVEVEYRVDIAAWRGESQDAPSLPMQGDASLPQPIDRARPKTVVSAATTTTTAAVAAAATPI